ncbi:recombinase family protein [Planctomycetaceae bacterium]|nr:recombinase family protein [Planctomycetaceae bacterium]
MKFGESSQGFSSLKSDCSALDVDTAYTDLYPIMRELREEGVSLRAIARHLNDDGYETRRGRPWNHVQVRSVLRRYEAWSSKPVG